MALIRMPFPLELHGVYTAVADREAEHGPEAMPEAGGLKAHFRYQAPLFHQAASQCPGKYPSLCHKYSLFPQTSLSDCSRASFPHGVTSYFHRFIGLVAWITHITNIAIAVRMQLCLLHSLHGLRGIDGYWTFLSRFPCSWTSFNFTEGFIKPSLIVTEILGSPLKKTQKFLFPFWP